MLFLLIGFKTFTIKREEETPAVFSSCPSASGLLRPRLFPARPWPPPPSTSASPAGLSWDHYLTFSACPNGVSAPLQTLVSHLLKTQRRSTPQDTDKAGGRLGRTTGPKSRGAGPVEGPRGSAGEGRAARGPEAWGSGANRLHFPGTGTRRSGGVLGGGLLKAAGQ